MNRKNFLLLTTAGAIATLTPFCTHRRSEPALAQPLFLSTICDLHTLRQIGTKYRTTTPAETSEDVLTHLLTTNGEPTKQVTEDFSSNHTVTINGWIISITEARQCALYSLQST